MPKVSIIIPVYNAEKCLSRCVDSVLSQTFTDWELVLVDDGSTDDSFALCQQTQEANGATDGRITVISQENGGPSKARNAGLEVAKGDYVYFMDADDWVERTFLSSFFGKEEENRNDVIFQGFVREYPDGRSEASFAMDADTGVMSKEDIICLLYKNHVYGWAWCKLFKREIIERYGIRFDESLNLWEDELFTTEFLQRAESIKTVNTHLYHYIYSPTSLMQTGNTYLKRLFLSERMNEALTPIANRELREYIETTYNRNLKYSLLMALKNEQNHLCDKAMKEKLLERYYARCKEYPELRKYKVLSNTLSYFIAESVLQTRWKTFIIALFPKITRG